MKKTIRTVQLGFFRHEADDPIVNVAAPRFRTTCATQMPTQDTKDFMQECPRIYPIRGDTELESMSRDVLSDLFWMSCCRSAALASVTPSSRRGGAIQLLSRISDVCRAATSVKCMDDIALREIVSTLGSTLHSSDASALVTSCRGQGVSPEQLLWEPVLGDCEVAYLVDLGQRFTDRASRAMFFLSHKATLPDTKYDLLVSNLEEGCRRLVELAEPQSIFADRSKIWVRELLTGVPQQPAAYSVAAEKKTPSHLMYSFGARRSVYIPYVRPSTSEEEDMFRSAIFGTSAPSTDARVPSPPSHPKGQGSVYSARLTSRSVPSSVLRVEGCTPALQRWFNSTRVRRGCSSQQVSQTVANSPQSTVSHSAFAKLSIPVFSQGVQQSVPSYMYTPTPSLDDRQGRRELARHDKVHRYEAEMVAGVVQSLRICMRSTLRRMQSEVHVGSADSLLTDLLALKDQFDAVFSDLTVSRALSTSDRKDVRDRLLFLAKLIGSQRRALSADTH